MRQTLLLFLFFFLLMIFLFSFRLILIPFLHVHLLLFLHILLFSLLSLLPPLFLFFYSCFPSSSSCLAHSSMSTFCCPFIFLFIVSPFSHILLYRLPLPPSDAHSILSCVRLALLHITFYFLCPFSPLFLLFILLFLFIFVVVLFLFFLFFLQS